MSGWSGGSGLFFVLFFEMEKGPMWMFFLIVLSCFVDFWSLEVTFSVILVSLGRLWTRLVPGGVQGADLVEIVRSSGLFWLHFGVIDGVRR